MPMEASFEYSTFLSATDKMTSEISADPVTVASKLMARGLIPPVSLSSALLPTREKELKACELVKQVGNKIRYFPDNFVIFLEVLNEMQWLQQLAQWIRKEFDKAKAASMNLKGIVDQKMGSHNKVEKGVPLLHAVSQLDSENDQDQVPASHVEKFPYLKAETLSEGRKQKLLARLQRESGKMQDMFAILVDRTRESLEKRQIQCSDLIVLTKYSQKGKLVNLVKQVDSIKQLFLELWEFWSFFDYEFLGVIINRFCSELRTELTEYVSCFKEYCKRRICEVPEDVFKKRVDEECNLYVKCDYKFDITTVNDVKDLECQLSDLLGTELYLLGVEEGCLTLIFSASNALSTPLKENQIKELTKLRIFYICGRNSVYFHSGVDQLERPICYELGHQGVSDDEIRIIANAIMKAGKLEALVKALPMSGECGDVKSAIMYLLAWREKIKFPPRPFLLHHLKNLKMTDLVANISRLAEKQRELRMRIAKDNTPKVNTIFSQHTGSERSVSPAHAKLPPSSQKKIDLWYRFPEKRSRGHSQDNRKLDSGLFKKVKLPTTNQPTSNEPPLPLSLRLSSLYSAKGVDKVLMKFMNPHLPECQPQDCAESHCKYFRWFIDHNKECKSEQCASCTKLKNWMSLHIDSCKDPSQCSLQICYTMKKLQLKDIIQQLGSSRFVSKPASGSGSHYPTTHFNASDSHIAKQSRLGRSNFHVTAGSDSNSNSSKGSRTLQHLATSSVFLQHSFVARSSQNPHTSSSYSDKKVVPPSKLRKGPSKAIVSQKTTSASISASLASIRERIYCGENIGSEIEQRQLIEHTLSLFQAFNRTLIGRIKTEFVEHKSVSGQENFDNAALGCLDMESASFDHTSSVSLSDTKEGASSVSQPSPPHDSGPGEIFYSVAEMTSDFSHLNISEPLTSSLCHAPSYQSGGLQAYENSSSDDNDTLSSFSSLETLEDLDPHIFEQISDSEASQEEDGGDYSNFPLSFRMSGIRQHHSQLGGIETEAEGGDVLMENAEIELPQAAVEMFDPPEEYRSDFLLGQLIREQEYREGSQWRRLTKLSKRSRATYYKILDLKTNLSLTLQEKLEDEKSLDEVYICLKLANERNVSSNIVEYFGAVMLPKWPGNTVQIFMEVMPTSMQTHLFQNGPLAMSDVRHYSYQLFDALEYLHNKERIIHCDVKPANLLLDHTARRMKLADFGSAEILENTGNLIVSRKGALCYNPPEHYLNHECSFALDLWQAGCCVLAMSTGRRPWRHLFMDPLPGSRRLINQLKKSYGEVIGHEKHGHILPGFLDATISRLLYGCLHPDPKQRLTALECRQLLASSDVQSEDQRMTVTESVEDLSDLSTPLVLQNNPDPASLPKTDIFLASFYQEVKVKGHGHTLYPGWVGSLPYSPAMTYQQLRHEILKPVFPVLEHLGPLLLGVWGGTPQEFFVATNPSRSSLQSPSSSPSLMHHPLFIPASPQAPVDPSKPVLLFTPFRLQQRHCSNVSSETALTHSNRRASF